jgi:hypothetical protein
MPRTTKKTVGEPTLARLKAQGIRPEDIDEIWLDEMVKRLFSELKRQLSQVESADPATGSGSSERGANARTLAALERTLERLAKLEQQRIERREKKVAPKHDGVREALERKIDRLAAAVGAPKDSDGLE